MNTTYAGFSDLSYTWNFASFGCTKHCKPNQKRSFSAFFRSSFGYFPKKSQEMRWISPEYLLRWGWIFDFCAISRRLISKDSIHSPNFSCHGGCAPAERALWCRDSKRQALGNYFSVRICYELPISKCRREWDLGLCPFWVPWLKFVNPWNDGKIRFFLRAKRVFFRKSLLLSGSLFASTQKVHRPRCQSPLQSDIRNLQQIRTQKHFLSVCARRSHRRAVLLQTLRWLSKFSKKICRGCRIKQVRDFKRRLFRQCHFQTRHHEVFLQRSRSDFHVVNFWEHSRIRSCSFNYCSKINQSELYK